MAKDFYAMADIHSSDTRGDGEEWDVVEEFEWKGGKMEKDFTKESSRVVERAGEQPRGRVTGWRASGRAEWKEGERG